MFKNIFSIFLFVFISVISCYLTSLATDYIKKIDPLMQTIEENKSLYEKETINAVYDDISIIPGISGMGIDFDSSYAIMKKYGEFNDNLLVFNRIEPDISYTKIFNKYVMRGNPSKNNITLIFKIRDTNYLEEIISILHEKDVIGTFFIDDEVLKENQDIIKLLYLNNQKIESLGSNDQYDEIEINSMNKYLKSYTTKTLSYCYSDGVNQEILKACSNKKMHTIIPTINTDKFPYYELKYKLENGAIIKFNNNIRTVEELRYVINYIKQNNYKIVSLEKLLEE